MSYAEADTHDTVYFPLALSTIHRGPVQFAGRWSYISTRGTTGHRSDFGDLKIYGRYLVPVFRDSTDVQREEGHGEEGDGELEGDCRDRKGRRKR